MSFDRSKKLISRTGLFAGLTTLILLGGCQVRPLYSEAQGTGERLAALSFSDPDSRVEQAVRNHLIFLTSGGAGEAITPEYNVKLDASSSVSDVLDEDLSTTGVPVPGRVLVSANYSVSRVNDGQILKAGTREVTSLIDVPTQGFAKVRAIRDAENRASRELAEFIRADLAIVLAREPKPQPPQIWQK